MQHNEFINVMLLIKIATKLATKYINKTYRCCV